jgi:probable F420-dependent oxidoreductase
MKIDGPFYAQLDTAADEAKRLGDMGYDGVYTLEGNSDPFLPLVLASEHQPNLDIATGIAVALPRNPSHIAYQAWDLQRFSKGKFMLGIGPQIKAHNERRFGVPFDRPAARMKEYIQAVKAFFACWHDDERLNFEGEFFHHTLMTPMFNPGPNPYGKPPILLGAMGPRMTAVAGEVADGLIVHPFNTLPFVLNEQLPGVRKALAKSGRSEEDFIMQVGTMIVTGANEEEYKAADEAMRGLLAFYASTPAYRPPMEAVGYGDLQPELNKMTKEGRWDELSQLIDDDFLNHFAVCAEPKDVAAKVVEKYGEFTDRASIYAPYHSSPEVWPAIISDMKKLTGR